MEIIREGDISRLEPVYRFECPICGCIYEAVKSECRPVIVGYNYNEDEEYYYKCPTCEYEVAGKTKRI